MMSLQLSKESSGGGKKSFLLVALLMLLSLANSIAATESETVEIEDYEEDDDDDESVVVERKEVVVDPNVCQLYLAESSIPDAGFGIFTARTIEKGEKIFDRDGASICVTDPLWDNYPDVLKNVLWDMGDGIMMGDIMSYEAQDPMEFQITMGSLTNHHPFLVNFKYDGDSDSDDYGSDAVKDDDDDVILEYDDRLANRSTDPGAGAFSYYTKKKFRAVKKIEAGKELFLDYGENWLNTGARTDDFGDLLTARHYETAGRMLSKLTTFISHVLKEDEYPSVISISQCQQELTYMQNKHIDTRHKETTPLLPKTYDEFWEICKTAGAYNKKKLAIALAEKYSLKSPSRTVEWIQENGKCLDNMEAKKSTIAGAGRGGFARRAISEGETIVPVPLVHIAERGVLSSSTKKEKEQLLVNYCFGHDESSLLLCPMTNAALINHCGKKIGCGPNGPNAKYQWASSSWDPTTTKYLDKSIEDLVESRIDRVLSMEIVALRDIEAGEEIFIDYGETWEDAWESHVESWKSSHSTPSDINEHHSLARLNLDREADIVLMPTTDKDDEEAEDPLRADFPAHGGGVYTVCQFRNKKDICPRKSRRFKTTDTKDWKQASDEEIISHYGKADGSMFVDDPKTEFWPCSVVSKDDKDNDADDTSMTYTVRIFQSDLKKRTDWTKQKQPCIIQNYPRDLIGYYPVPYESDQHLPDAFRHPIGIRDEIFPAQWKNLKENGEEEQSASQDESEAEL